MFGLFLNHEKNMLFMDPCNAHNNITKMCTKWKQIKELLLFVLDNILIYLYSPVADQAKQNQI